MHYGSGIQTKNGLLSDIKSNLAKRIAHTVAEELKVDDMGDKLVGKQEHCHVQKEFKGKQCADKK